MKKIVVVFQGNDEILFAASNYREAVNILFGNMWISPKEEILIDNEWTTLEDFFGEEVIDMMANEWDIDDFNEFWNHDIYMEETEYYD